VRTVLVVGIGAGDPDQLTVEAIRALNRADAILTIDRADELDDLAAARRAICDRYLRGPYRELHVADSERGRGAAAVAAWRARRAEGLGRLIAQLGDDETGAILVWGDPAFYDGTLAILDTVAATVPFDHEVIPGISSLQALAARHRIVLTRLGRPLTVSPGRLLAETLARGAGDVAVMLDADCAFTAFPDLDIYWGAYLGMAGELLIAGRVGAVGEEIRRVRAEARARRGWMFDTYLLRAP
jgi:precorrin-6A synthase